MTTNTLTHDHSRRRPYHLIAGTIVFVSIYAIAVAVVRVTILSR